MTKESLDKGIALNRSIEKMSSERKNLEFIKDLISGGGYTCSIEITPNSGKRYSAVISDDSAKAAIDSDIDTIHKNIVKASEEFSAL